MGFSFRIRRTKQVREPALANGGTYYYLTDGLGSVTDLTDQNGAVVREYRYDSFGGLFTARMMPQAEEPAQPPVPKNSVDQGAEYPGEAHNAADYNRYISDLQNTEEYATQRRVELPDGRDKVLQRTKATSETRANDRYVLRTRI